MPYTKISELPENVRKLPEKKQRQWMAVWNSSFNRCMKNGDQKSCESKAFAQANGVVLSKDAEEAIAALVETEGFADLPECDFHDRVVQLLVELSEKESLIEDDVAESVDEIEFSAQSSVEGGLVVRRGLIFRAGDYPDKSFSCTPEEMAHAVSSFDGPVPIDLEHVPTILDGQLGQLRSVELGSDGLSLYGEVAIPEWLNKLVGETKLKVSTTWDRATKQIVKLALVMNPRVEDAAVMAAFAADFATKRHDTPHGQQSLQFMHDMSARAGAVCKSTNASMTAKHEALAMQQVHDLCVKNGAACSTTERKNGNPYYFSDDGANTPPKKGAGIVSGIKDKILALFAEEVEEGGEGAAGGAPPAPAAQKTPPVAPGATGSATSTFSDAERDELERGRRELASMRAQNERLRAQRVEAEAAAFVDGLIKDSRIFPSQRDGMVALFSQACYDDDAVGQVTLSDGKTTNRVDQLKAVMTAGEKHILSTEQLGAEFHRVLLNNGRTEGEGDPNRKLSDEELRKMINLTNLGQAAMSATNGANGSK